jgi:hypothetical protein
MESMEEGFLAKILVPDGAKDIPVGEVILSSKKNYLISLLGCFVVFFSMKGRFEECARRLLAFLAFLLRDY